MRKMMFMTICLLTSNVFAENCPSVNDLRTNHTRQWKAYDSDNNHLLSNARTAKLKHDIAHFAMAEWTQTKHKSAIHCYYNNEHGSAMEAYFAKDSTLPIKSSKYWYPVTGMMQCAAGADKCQFQSLPGVEHQFASNDVVESAS